MTGPADDAELVVKMLNSGAPGVMLDLEDSNANTWEHLTAFMRLPRRRPKWSAMPQPVTEERIA